MLGAVGGREGCCRAYWILLTCRRWSTPRASPPAPSPARWPPSGRPLCPSCPAGGLTIAGLTGHVEAELVTHLFLGYVLADMAWVGAAAAAVQGAGLAAPQFPGCLLAGGVAWAGRRSCRRSWALGLIRTRRQARAACVPSLWHALGSSPASPRCPRAAAGVFHSGRGALAARRDPAAPFRDRLPAVRAAALPAPAQVSEGASAHARRARSLAGAAAAMPACPVGPAGDSRAQTCCCACADWPVELTARAGSPPRLCPPPLHTCTHAHTHPPSQVHLHRRPCGAQHLFPHRPPPVAPAAKVLQVRAGPPAPGVRGRWPPLPRCHPTPPSGTSARRAPRPAAPAFLSVLRAPCPPPACPVVFVAGWARRHALAAPPHTLAALPFPPPHPPCCSLAYWGSFVPMRLVVYPALIPVFLSEMRAARASWWETLVCVGSQVGRRRSVCLCRVACEARECRRCCLLVGPAGPACSAGAGPRYLRLLPLSLPPPSLAPRDGSPFPASLPAACAARAQVWAAPPLPPPPPRSCSPASTSCCWRCRS